MKIENEELKIKFSLFSSNNERITFATGTNVWYDSGARAIIRNYFFAGWQEIELKVRASEQESSLLELLQWAPPNFNEVKVEKRASEQESSLLELLQWAPPNFNEVKVEKIDEGWLVNHRNAIG